ncbi:MAG: TolC family protein [Syntrophomonadaceae bacterium]
MRKIMTLCLTICMLLGIWIMPAAAADEQTAGLTLDQAVAMALKHSTALKLANYSTDQSKNTFEVAEMRASDYTVTGPLYTTDVWAVFSNADAQYLSYRITSEREKITKDSVVISTVQKYMAVLSARDAAQNATKSLAAAEWSRMASQAMYRVGMMSEFALSQSEDSYQGSRNAYNQAQTALASAYRDLNYLTGSTVIQPLVSTPSYSPYDLSSLDGRIAGIIENSPSIWISDKSVNQAQMSANMADAPTSKEYENLQTNIDKAELSAADTRTQAKMKLKTLAETIQKCEDNYQTAKHNLDTANKNLLIKRLMYELGMATKGDVLTAEVSQANAQKALDDLVIQHEITKMQFEKPWTS